jgi:hypothetical protein
MGAEWNLHINAKTQEEKPYFTAEGLTFRLHALKKEERKKNPFSDYFPLVLSPLLDL